MTVPLELEIDLNHNQFAIDTRSTILEALKRMDENNCKLLIVNKDGVYSTLITIGDIQRAIIQNISLSTPLMDVHIQPKVVCLDTDSDDTIKKHLKNMRSQFMPVLNKEGHLVRIVFWEELLESKDLSLKKPLNLPVVIMAGGKGLRLKPISNIIPKPLIPIGDKTIVENIMDRFIDSGCSKFHLTVNYKKELIQHLSLIHI